MSGFMEILLIIALILGIFVLPKRMTRNQDKGMVGLNDRFRPKGWTRLAIVTSVIWPAVVFFFMQPWNDRWFPFLYIAVGPVALIWAVAWIFSGFLKERR